MTYFYNSSTGGFANESPPAPQYFTYEIQLHLGQGWHAYGTIAEMNAAIAANHWPPADASKGLLSGTSTAPSTPARAANAVKNGLLGSYSLVFGNTTGLLGRILKVIIGGTMMIIGIAKMSGASDKVNQILPVLAKVPV